MNARDNGVDVGCGVWLQFPNEVASDATGGGACLIISGDWQGTGCALTAITNHGQGCWWDDEPPVTSRRRQMASWGTRCADLAYPMCYIAADPCHAKQSTSFWL